jgi:hypothetical protein
LAKWFFLKRVGSLVPGYAIFEKRASSGLASSLRHALPQEDALGGSASSDFLEKYDSVLRGNTGFSSTSPPHEGRRKVSKALRLLFF